MHVVVLVARRRRWVENGVDASVSEAYGRRNGTEVAIHVGAVQAPTITPLDVSTNAFFKERWTALR
jgi:hypothetical protein